MARMARMEKTARWSTARPAICFVALCVHRGSKGRIPYLPESRLGTGSACISSGSDSERTNLRKSVKSADPSLLVAADVPALGVNHEGTPAAGIL